MDKNFELKTSVPSMLIFALSFITIAIFEALCIFAGIQLLLNNFPVWISIALFVQMVVVVLLFVLFYYVKNRIVLILLNFLAMALTLVVIFTTMFGMTSAFLFAIPIVVIVFSAWFFITTTMALFKKAK